MGSLLQPVLGNDCTNESNIGHLISTLTNKQKKIGKIRRTFPPNPACEEKATTNTNTTRERERKRERQRERERKREKGEREGEREI